MKRIILLLLCCSAVAHAGPSLTGKVSLTGLYYSEQEQVSGTGRPVLASPAQLGFGDLRVLLIGDRLARDHFDFRLDVRVRGTGSFDFERKYDLQPLAAPPPTVTARGYLGGPEYDLREVYVALKLTSRVRLQLGRMFIPEGDMLKVDALRLQVRLGDHWSSSLFAGGYPNPYSRSVLTDYEPPCGSGVASGNIDLKLTAPISPTPASVPAASSPCQTAGAQLAVAGGLTAAYQYSSVWGTVGVVGSFLGDTGDGGVVIADPSRTTTVGNLLPPSAERDSPRVYVSWVNHVQPIERLDIFSNLVVDFVGSDGPQLTRALVLGNLRLLPAERLTLRLTYSHMSSLAINMYLNRQLYNRSANGTTLANLGVAENNLTVLRTGRDEVRLNADIKLVARLVLYLEGRLRYRGLLNADSNPAVYESALYTDQTRSAAGDFTIGLRDGGSIKALRAGISYLFLQDFRARSHVMRVALGRSFWRDRFSIDADYVAILVTDGGAGGTSCNANQFPVAVQDSQVFQLNKQTSVFLADCYGRRNGVTHEAGMTLTLNPWRQFFLLADYRFTALFTDPQTDAQGVKAAVPTILAHSALLRAEFGF